VIRLRCLSHGFTSDRFEEFQLSRKDPVEFTGNVVAS
jgi:hypothetical protein